MPLANQVNQDKLLTQVSVKYSNSEYIAERAAPAVGVRKTDGDYFIFDRNFRVPETIRAETGKAREHDFDLSTASYALERHALKGYIGPDERDNYDPGDLRRDMTEDLTDKILARKEKSLAALMTSTSWSLNVSLASANAWSANTTVSNPIPVVDTGVSTVIANSGRKPNYMILPHDSFIAAKNHTSIAERVKYTQVEINAQILGTLFDIPEILVPHSQEDTAAKGVTSSISSILSTDKVFLGFKPQRAGRRVPSSLYQFQKRSGRTTRRWMDKERNDSEAIEVQDHYQFKVVASLTGYLIIDTL